MQLYYLPCPLLLAFSASEPQPQTRLRNTFIRGVKRENNRERYARTRYNFPFVQKQKRERKKIRTFI
uniref:Uncharacterized protein n=1 Tax=Manihot esculenta TaxID=3983 RepID=A0A199U9D0_MANES